MLRLTLCLCLACATTVHAQSAINPAAPVADPMKTPGPASLTPVAAARTARFDELQRLRLQSREERRSSGFWLLAWGVANAAGGALVAAFGHENERHIWLAAGLTAASFGIINALLTPSLLDLSGDRQRRILASQPRAQSDYVRVREQELVAELKSGQTFAFNFGLDVAYITAGALLYVIGRVRSDETGWQEAAGITIVGEGLFLLGFDLIEWFATGRRAAALRALPSD